MGGEVLMREWRRLLPKDFRIRDHTRFFDVPPELSSHQLTASPHHEEIIVSLERRDGHRDCTFLMSQLPAGCRLHSALSDLLEKIQKIVEEGPKYEPCAKRHCGRERPRALGDDSAVRKLRVFCLPVFAGKSTVELSEMKKRKPKRSSPADAFRKQLMRWRDEGRKLQKQYDKLHQRGEVQRIEIFELGFEPLLVEVTPIQVDLGALQPPPQGAP
jgi:hypothetical protein